MSARDGDIRLVLHSCGASLCVFCTQQDESNNKINNHNKKTIKKKMRTTRQKFNLILTLAAMLTMAQTAWAVTEEVTETWTMI